MAFETIEPSSTIQPDFNTHSPAKLILEPKDISPEKDIDERALK